MAKIKTCGLYIVNKSGKLLICHPTHHSPNFWSIPKGKLDEGESYLEGAIRETQEETNIDFNLAKGKVIFHYLAPTVYRSKRKTLFGFAVFENEFDDSMPFDLDKIEIKCNSMVDDKDFPENDDFKWVSLSEAANLLHESQIPNLIKIKNIIDGKENQ